MSKISTLNRTIFGNTCFIFFLFSNLAVYSQEVDLKIIFKIYDGFESYSLENESDTTFLRLYSSCSEGYGIVLKDTLPNGTYRVWQNDTIHLSGTFENRVKSGIWKYYTHGELTCSQEYNNGKVHGKIYVYHKGKLTESREYNNGQIHGKSCTYHQDGSIGIETWWSENELTRIIEYDESGFVVSDSSK
ncbi:MAG: hypothetical protein ACI857_001428 [Arenicella sp.]|jgi:hypothetical protein